MKKEWVIPAIEEIAISATENGEKASTDFDGPWVQVEDRWYRPGSGKNSITV